MHQQLDADRATGTRSEHRDDDRLGVRRRPEAPEGTLPPTPPPPAGPSGGGASRGRRGRRGLALLAAGAILGGGAGAGTAALLDPGSSSSTVLAAQGVVITRPQDATAATAAAAKALPSVVTVYVSGAGRSGSGSGVIVSADGYVLTNDHVVTLDGSTSAVAVQVRTADGNVHDGTVVGTDPTSDLAIVRVSGADGLTPATFADSSAVQIGDLAVALGSPLGLSNTVTEGIVSATGRAVATGSNPDQTVIEAIQTDAAVNPGDSGGPLVDAAGDVIGINSAIATVAGGGPGRPAQAGNIGVGFAIPATTAQRIATELISNGRATHAVLGVSTQTAADPRAPQVGLGAQVMQVQPGGPAAAAGIRAGEVITAVDGHPVTDSVDLTAYIRSAAPGQQIRLAVQDGGTIPVTLGTAQA